MISCAFGDRCELVQLGVELVPEDETVKLSVGRICRNCFDADNLATRLSQETERRATEATKFLKPKTMAKAPTKLLSGEGKSSDCAEKVVKKGEEATSLQSVQLKPRTVGAVQLTPRLSEQEKKREKKSEEKRKQEARPVNSSRRADQAPPR